MCQTCVVHVSCMFSVHVPDMFETCAVHVVEYTVLTLECSGEVWTLIIFPPLLLAPLVVPALAADCIECRGGG